MHFLHHRADKDTVRLQVELMKVLISFYNISKGLTNARGRFRWYSKALKILITLHHILWQFSHAIISSSLAYSRVVHVEKDL
jgi:hypothetical protein